MLRAMLLFSTEFAQHNWDLLVATQCKDLVISGIENADYLISLTSVRFPRGSTSTRVDVNEGEFFV